MLYDVFIRKWVVNSLWIYYIIINIIDNIDFEIVKSRVIFVIYVCVVVIMCVYLNVDWNKIYVFNILFLRW